MKCENCYGSGSIEMETTNFSQDPNASPDVKLVECDACGGCGEIEGEDYEMPELKQIGEDFDNLNLNFLK